MLNADPSRDFHLVCKPNGKRPRGRPSRSLKERIRDSEIGVRVEHSIKNGKEYKIAIYEAATEFGVKEPTAAKAYTTFKALLEAAEISDKTADKT
jgi:hypothetical protein